ncbi:uncharacterized protein LOC144868940 [Branchiostoma floridae x Branchiostoma japonicum]
MQSVAQMLALTTAVGCAMFAVSAGRTGPCENLSPTHTQRMLCLKKYLPCSTSADCPEGLACGCSAVCGSVCRETGAAFPVLKRDGGDGENDGSCPAQSAHSTLSDWYAWTAFGCVHSCSSDTDCDEQHPEEEGSYKCCDYYCGKRCLLAVHSI